MNPLRSFHRTGHLAEELWEDAAGLAHRDDGPALIRYYPGGNLQMAQWLVHGQNHRDDGPSYISYYEDGQTSAREYSKRNVRHREDGPAFTAWSESGVVIIETWDLYGVTVHKEYFAALLALPRLDLLIELFKLTKYAYLLEDISAINSSAAKSLQAAIVMS